MPYTTGVEALPRKKLPKSNGFSRPDYSHATVGAGGNAGGMAQGTSGVAESDEKSEEIIEPIVDTSDKFSKSADEDDSKEKYVHEYSCVMAQLSPAVSGILAYWVQKNIPFESLYIDEDDGHDGYIPVDEFHTTVKYGLLTSNPEDISKILDGYTPFNISFSNVTKFKNDKFDVLKIDIKKDPILLELNKEITKTLDCPGDTHPEYHPHITLAYLKKGECENLINNDFFDKLQDEINEIWFTGKDGKEYFIELDNE